MQRLWPGNDKKNRFTPLRANGYSAGVVNGLPDLDYLRALGLGGRVDGWKQFFIETLEKQD